jgi:hypothetical protein
MDFEQVLTQISMLLDFDLTLQALISSPWLGRNKASLFVFPPRSLRALYLPTTNILLDICTLTSVGVAHQLIFSSAIHSLHAYHGHFNIGSTVLYSIHICDAEPPNAEGCRVNHI